MTAITSTPTTPQGITTGAAGATARAVAAGAVAVAVAVAAAAAAPRATRDTGLDEPPSRVS